MPPIGDRGSEQETRPPSVESLESISTGSPGLNGSTGSCHACWHSGPMKAAASPALGVCQRLQQQVLAGAAACRRSSPLAHAVSAQVGDACLCPPPCSPLQTLFLTEPDRSRFQDGLIQFSSVFFFLFARLGDAQLPPHPELAAVNAAPRRWVLLAALAAAEQGGQGSWAHACRRDPQPSPPSLVLPGWKRRGTRGR